MADPTQMLILSIPASKPIEDPTSPAGTTWQEILELIRKSEGYKRLYWGRHVEKPDHVQLHIGKDLLTPSRNTISSHPQPSSTHPCPRISHYLLDTSFLISNYKKHLTHNSPQSPLTPPHLPHLLLPSPHNPPAPPHYQHQANNPPRSHLRVFKTV
jgi:hypothetical protein